MSVNSDHVVDHVDMDDSALVSHALRPPSWRQPSSTSSSSSSSSSSNNKFSPPSTPPTPSILSVKFARSAVTSRAASPFENVPRSALPAPPAQGHLHSVVVYDGVRARKLEDNFAKSSSDEGEQQTSSGATRTWPLYLIVLLEFVAVMSTFPAVTPTLNAYYQNDFSRTAWILGLVDGVGAALSFCLTPIYGHLSDRVGRRRPFILLSLFATSLPFVALSSELPIPVYLVLRCVTQGFLAQDFGIILSYLADCTLPEERSRAFGFLTAAFAIAFSFGPLLNLIMSSHQVFLVASILSGVNLLFAFSALPESYSPIPRAISVNHEIPSKQQQAESTSLLSPVASSPVVSYSEPSSPTNSSHSSFSSDSVNSVSSISPSTNDAAKPPAEFSWNPFRSMSILWRTRYLTLLALITFFEGVSENGIIDIVLIYLQDKLGFTRHDNVILLSGDGIAVSLSQFLLYPCLLRFWPVKWVLAFSLFFNAVHVLLFAVLWSYWTIYLIMITTGVGRIFSAALAALTSQHVDASMQGQAQGAMSAVQSLTRGLGPATFSGLYSLFTSSHSPIGRCPQAPFYFGSACVFVAFALCVLSLPVHTPTFAEEALDSHE